MTERTFTYTWTDAKRLTVLHALGFMFVKFEKSPPAVTEAILGLIGELSTVSGKDAPRNQTGASSESAAFIKLEPEPTDYFAANKKGDIPANAPDGAELSHVKLVSAQQPRGKEYLTVIFAAGYTADGVVRPAGKANCFDKQLWRFIQNRENQTASLWIMASGNYLNIVGVRQ
jgi:hypothetical protein